MEEIRDSIITQSDELNSKKHLFYEFFLKKYNINSDDIVNDTNILFLKHLPPDSLLFDTYKKSCKSIEGDLTLDLFINDLIDTVKVLHYQILEENNKVSKLKENLRVIDVIVKKMEATTKDESIPENPMNIFISYVKDKKYESDIFKFCRLKYKIAINSENYYSIYSEKKHRVCCVTIPKDLDTIFIHILGKKNGNYNDYEDFKIIATASVPMLVLYSSIKPIYFDLDDIPPIYQVINYEYENEENFLGSGQNEISSTFELKFEIKANKSERVRIMKGLQNYYPDIIAENESLINKRILLIQELLMPFDGGIIYDRNSEVFLKKNAERSCDFCFLI